VKKDYANLQFFIGIDVSKATLDLTLRDAAQVCDYLKIDNDQASIGQCLGQWQAQYGFQADQCLVCLENTGRYMNVLLRTLCMQAFALWVENALAIKRSAGLQRGKNDKADAHRIAEYAFRHRDKAVLYRPAGDSLEKLKVLQAGREQLLNTKQRLFTDLKESRCCQPLKLYQLQAQSYLPIIDILDKQIKELDSQMEQVISEDENLAHLQRIVCSVPGVGKVTSVALLLATQGFTKFSSAKKLACYCGVVPFEYSSGSSVRGKTRLSPFAHKGLKSLLHMCAMVAIQQEGYLKTFYQRKVAQGKAKMSALNAVKNKIIQRIMALDRYGRTYEKNRAFVLA
jgi:transposase